MNAERILLREELEQNERLINSFRGVVFPEVKLMKTDLEIRNSIILGELKNIEVGELDANFAKVYVKSIP